MDATNGTPPLAFSLLLLFLLLLLFVSSSSLSLSLLVQLDTTMADAVAAAILCDRHVARDSLYTHVHMCVIIRKYCGKCGYNATKYLITYNLSSEVLEPEIYYFKTPIVMEKFYVASMIISREGTHKIISGHRI
uniref:Uncharacterized protein n=1 Tax=Onchocerca volvulus TaxID=6282 RepID=A0A8R1TP01_ONCVO